jgi:hypothetical protein
MNCISRVLRQRGRTCIVLIPLPPLQASSSKCGILDSLSMSVQGTCLYSPKSELFCLALNFLRSASLFIYWPNKEFMSHDRPGTSLMTLSEVAAAPLNSAKSCNFTRKKITSKFVHAPSLNRLKSNYGILLILSRAGSGIPKFLKASILFKQA